jgi:hypothetical protein
MTPSEVIRTILDLGICFQLKLDQKNAAQPKEDWSQVGFNTEKEEDVDAEQAYYDKLKVVTDPEKLWGYSQWILAQEAPKKIAKKFDGPMVSVFLDKKRRLTIRGDDIPFGGGGMLLKFNCEHIKSVELKKSLLVITTIFGQTGVMVPKTGV